MIRHIVIINFRKDLDLDFASLLEETRPYIDQIPGIVKYSIFINISKYTPQDVCSLGVEILFEDEQALETFMNHPKHYEANALFEKHLADPPFMVLTHEA